ncbi:permease [Pontiella desulfatans]|nr:permease [Pontiella desulfatans]
MIAKMFISAAPYVVLGFIIAGVLHQWVPRDLLRRHLGGRGGLPLLKGVGIGSFLPICSCGTIPLGIGLYRCGAGIGTILAFMTSSPILSPVVVLVSFKLLGLKMTATLLGTALVGSFVIGWMGNRFFSKGRKDKPDEQLQYERAPKKGERSFGQWFRWTFGDLGASVGFELVLGLTVATLVMAFLPLEFISEWLGSGRIISLVLIVLLSLPVYTCSVPSVPIVQSLLLLGVSPGAAVVYLMAGPATNMGELNAIRANMGKKVAGFYGLALIVVALSAGLVTDYFIFSDYRYLADQVDGTLVVQQCCIPVLYNQTSIYAVDFTSVSWVEWISTAILAVVVAYGFFKELRAFFVNPCKVCRWREYAEEKKCAQKCHVRRKHDLFRKLTR